MGQKSTDITIHFFSRLQSPILVSRNRTFVVFRANARFYLDPHALANQKAMSPFERPDRQAGSGLLPFWNFLGESSARL